MLAAYVAAVNKADARETRLLNRVQLDELGIGIQGHEPTRTTRRASWSYEVEKGVYWGLQISVNVASERSRKREEDFFFGSYSRLAFRVWDVLLLASKVWAC